MHSNDHLHRLICSMSRAEKRYFKLYTSRHLLGERSNHQTLFDAVSKMDVYDEKTLLKRLEGEAFVRRFPIAKRRLYDMILKSLDAFYAESSLENKLRRNMHHVEILFKKGLYKDAAKILRSIRRQACEKQMHTLLLDVKVWERKLMESTNYVELKKGEIEKAANEMDQLLSTIKTEGSLWELKSVLLNKIYKKGQVRNKSFQQELDKVMTHNALQQEPNSIKGKFLFHQTKGAYAFATSNLKDCEVHLRAQWELIEKESGQFADINNLKVAVLSNLVHVNNALGERHRAGQFLKRFRALPGELKDKMNEDLELRFFVTGTGLELDSIMQNASFSETKALLPDIEKGLERFERRIGTVRKAGLFYQIAYNLFASGDYGQALNWTNRLLSDVHIDKSEDTICFTHMLNLLIHVEQGNDKLIPYALRSTERFLKTRKRVYDFEAVFLSMIRGISKVKDAEREQVILLDFIAHCKTLFAEKKESPVFDRLHPIAWAKARMNRVSIEEELNERQNAA